MFTASETTGAMGRGSRLAERVTLLEREALGDLKGAFEGWGLQFNGQELQGVPAQLADLRGRFVALARTINDEALETAAITAFEMGLRREQAPAGDKALVGGMLWRLISRDSLQQAAVLSAAGARVWRDNPYATGRMFCSGCRFAVPAKPGGYDYTKRAESPPVPCVPACTECGGALGNDDGIQ